MQYLLLIYANEKTFETTPHGELDKMMSDYNALTQDLKKTNAYIGGNRLRNVTTATTVRVRDGKTQLTDGPFAETREQLGGYYLINAASLDEATKIAARIPGAHIGSIEVRPVFGE